MQPLVSVIVPIYNVEKYLNQCINSIINQTYKNLEIILVNDGSTDSSLEICYSYNDERIIILDKKNGGLSSARNIGLDNATGEYIYFLDSDDWISEECIEDLVILIKKEKVDIVQCNFEKVYNEDYQKIDDKEESITIYNNLEFLENMQTEEYFVVWNKLYKSTLWNNIRFPEGKIHEDVFTTYKIAYQTNTIAVFTKILVFYRQRPNSIMSSMYTINRLDLLEALEEKIEFMKKVNNKLYVLSLIDYSHTLINLYQLHLEFMKEDLETLKKLNIKAKKNNKIILKNKVNFKVKLKFFIFCYFYTAFKYLQRIYRKIQY